MHRIKVEMVNLVLRRIASSIEVDLERVETFAEFFDLSILFTILNFNHGSGQLKCRTSELLWAMHFPPRLFELKFIQVNGSFKFDTKYVAAYTEHVLLHPPYKRAFVLPRSFACCMKLHLCSADRSWRYMLRMQMIKHSEHRVWP